MKRAISMILTSLILGGIVAYCGFLMSQGAIHLTAQVTGKETGVARGLMIICLIVWYYSTIGSSNLNKPKVILSALGIMMIIYASYALVDPVNSNTFLSDTTRVAGVYIIIAALAGFIGTSGSDNQNTGTGSAAHRIKDAEVIEI